MFRRVINPILLLPIALCINSKNVLSSETKNFIDNVPGAKDRMHQIINAGHFSQENQPQALVEAILTI